MWKSIILLCSLIMIISCNGAAIKNDAWVQEFVIGNHPPILFYMVVKDMTIVELNYVMNQIPENEDPLHQELRSIILRLLDIRYSEEFLAHDLMFKEASSLEPTEEKEFTDKLLLAHNELTKAKFFNNQQEADALGQMASMAIPHSGIVVSKIAERYLNHGKEFDEIKLEESSKGYWSKLKQILPLISNWRNFQKAGKHLKMVALNIELLDEIVNKFENIAAKISNKMMVALMAKDDVKRRLNLVQNNLESIKRMKHDRINRFKSRLLIKIKRIGRISLIQKKFMDEMDTLCENHKFNICLVM